VSDLVRLQRECIWFREALRTLVDKARPDGAMMTMRVDRQAFRKMHEMLYPNIDRTPRADFPNWLTVPDTNAVVNTEDLQS